jgi:lipopolysaccharide/colanic/teichoic acid biosynthesis glycosyltransferase
MNKIRSMAHNVEAKSGAVWSQPNDPRITRFGRFLRESHLDELPQLLNVVKGEMSLIGPRPERPEIVAQIERSLPRYRERLQVRPGITGLAQMQLPPDSNLASVRRKLAYDIQYVHEIGPWLDLRISVSTVLYLVGHLATSMCHALTKSAKNAAEHRLETIEINQEEPFEIGISG